MRILDVAELKKLNIFADFVYSFDDGENITVYMTDTPEDLEQIPEIAVDNQINVREVIKFFKVHDLNNMVFGAISGNPWGPVVTSVYVSGIANNEIGEKLSKIVYGKQFAGRFEDLGPDTFENQVFYYIERE